MTRTKDKQREDLDKLIDFYNAQKDFMEGGRVIWVMFSPRALKSFAKPEGDFWLYRGYRLRRHKGAPL